MKEFFARNSKTMRALILVLVFFVLSACTIGGFNAPGKAYYAQKDSDIVFYLEYDTEKESDLQRLGAVYVNVGAVFGEVGTDFSLRFRRASVSSTSWLSSNMNNVSLGNIFSPDGSEAVGTNYNWVKVFDYTAEESGPISTTYRIIRLTIPCDMLINEVVFVDRGGDVIPAVVTEKEAGELIGNTTWQTHFRDFFHANDKTDEFGALGDPSNLVDAQNNFTQGDSAYSNFTQDEMYTLMQIDNILLGSHLPEGTFNADTDNGPLAALFPLLGTLIFGKSVFGLRIFSVLFAAATVALVYFFARRLFGKEGFALLAAALFAGGGLALTVGRLGLSMAPAAFFVLASYYFMFKFFADGISSENPAKSACGSILASGILFAFAFATDPKTVIAAVGVVVLFVLGAVKQARMHSAASRAVRLEMLSKNALEKSEDAMRANVEACERQEAALRAGRAYVNRLTYLLFIVGFVAAALAVVMLTALPSYYTYVNLYDPNPANASVGIFSLVGNAIRDSFALNNLTSYTASNASTAFGWLIALKGATLFSAHGEGTYIALNAQLNIGMALTALVAVLFMTVYAIVYIATGGKNGQYASERSPQILRAYIALMLGLVTSLLQYAFLGNVNAAYGYLFDLFYVAFIPLMFCTVYLHDGSKVTKVLGMPMNATAKVMAGLVAVYAVIFLLTVPMVFCIPFPSAAAAACFGWTSFLNNGFYRI